MTYCPHCGTAAAGRFCTGCGTDLAPAAAPEGPSAPAADDATTVLAVPPTWATTLPGLPAQPEPRGRRTALVAGVAVLALAAGGAGTWALLAARDGGPDVVSATAPASPSPVATARASAPPKVYEDFAEVYEAVSGAIVRIETDSCGWGGGVGTGFFVDDRHIATVAHVVQGASTLSMSVDGVPVVASVVGIDPSQDLALLETAERWRGPVVPLAPRDPKVGASVAALGFPKGLDLTLTRGTVSAVQTSVDELGLDGLVQTDTSLNPGNSGGPLLDLTGRAVGLVEAGRLDAEGISYAIGVDVAGPAFDAWARAGEPVDGMSCTLPEAPGAGDAPSYEEVPVEEEPAYEDEPLEVPEPEEPAYEDEPTYEEEPGYEEPAYEDEPTYEEDPGYGEPAPEETEGEAPPDDGTP